MSDLSARFWDKVAPEPNTGCWLWTGAGLPAGYGILWNGEWPEQAHRIAFRAVHGEIPDGKEIDHICRVRCCVNPDHLRAVTHRENMRVSDSIMGRNARKTHCKRGHEFDEANTYWTKSGARMCRKCGALKQREYKRRRRGL